VSSSQHVARSEMQSTVIDARNTTRSAIGKKVRNQSFVPTDTKLADRPTLLPGTNAASGPDSRAGEPTHNFRPSGNRPPHGRCELGAQPVCRQSRQNSSLSEGRSPVATPPGGGGKVEFCRASRHTPSDSSTVTRRIRRILANLKARKSIKFSRPVKIVIATPQGASRARVMAIDGLLRRNCRAIPKPKTIDALADAHYQAERSESVGHPIALMHS
jgi:hypothetical protein